jgi:hypothetical protein
MPARRLATACVLAAITAAAPAHAQQLSRLTCQGQISNMPAMLTGNRQFQQISAVGDGQVRFSGAIRARAADGRTIDGTIEYGGFTRLPPFEGVIVSPLGTTQIGVLDNTGGQMIIYSGKATLGPPAILGRFACNWN